jgi:hypothetical protein
MRELDATAIPAVNAELAKHAVAALPTVAPGSVGIMSTSAAPADACAP